MGTTNRKDMMSILGFCIVSLLTWYTTRRALEGQWQQVTAATTASFSGATILGQTQQQNKKQPLLHQLAPFIFTMNDRTGMIDLPDEIDTVLIDVGARESDYLTLLERRANDDPTAAQSIALILVDPLPDSIVPSQ